MRLRCLLFACAAAFAGLVMALPASADPLPAPGGFRLTAGNGYSLHARTFDGDPEGKQDALLLYFTRPGASVFYFAREGVGVTETSITADLGSLGSIDLQFVPTGTPSEESSQCDDEDVRVLVDSGFYEGRIDLEGEEGYTSVHAARARGDLRFLLCLIWGGGVAIEGSGGHAPGARLAVRRRFAGGQLKFEAKKNSPTRPSRFAAEIEERRGNLTIARAVSGEAGAGAFEFDVPDQVARLQPPAPFAGAAHFDRVGKRTGRLRGSLSVDFPGRSNVSLVGSRGSLQRYVENPSHPFRLTLASRLSAWPSTNSSPTAFATPSLLARR